MTYFDLKMFKYLLCKLALSILSLIVIPIMGKKLLDKNQQDFPLISLSSSLAMTAVSLVSGKEVCYPVVGCFNNDAPFNNADQALPSNPLELGTKFHLYTWEKTEVPTSLVYTQPVSIKKSNFRSDRPTKVIIHGLNNSERSQWIINMRRAFLKQVIMKH